MPLSPRHSPPDEYTVVLRSRGFSAPENAKYALKTTVSVHARGSPRGHPPVHERSRVGQPPHAPNGWDVLAYANTSREVDLLVRFGIDTAYGRVLARVLVWLMLLQPVYVAFGMELDGMDSGQLEVSSTEQIESSHVAADEVAGEDADEVQVPQEMELVAEEERSTDDVDVSTDVDTDVAAEEQYTDETDAAGSETSAEALENAETGHDTPPLDDVHTAASSSRATTSDPITGTEPSSTGTTGSGASSEATSSEGVADDASDDTAIIDEGEPGDDVSNETLDDASDTDTNLQFEESDGSEVVSLTGSSTKATSTDTARASVATTTATSSQVFEDMAVGVMRDDSNKYMFAEGECTLVADGEFYCVADDAPKQLTGDPRVYAEKDREGDREIYYFDGVEVQRITNNSYDDFAPVFDEETGRIVWQAMLNDRLQIFIHELATNATRQLTTSRTNSSNPDITGDIVVWQEWVDTNWEVMMVNVNNGGSPFVPERLTDNVVHDMFPQAYEGLVTWQSERGDSWEVVVYDLHTKKRHTLEKDEDTKYENPRFVLLFDSKHDNGDVETIGYDLQTGEMMELGTQSRRDPVVPVSPKDETSDALPREAATSTQLKVERKDGGTDGDVIL